MPDDPAQGAQIDMEAVVSGFLSKHNNDANKSIELLLTENYDLRQKNATLRTTVSEFEGSGLKEGEEVFDAERVSTFGKYLELGTPDELVKLKEDFASTAGELDSMRTDLVNRRIAANQSLDYDVLTRLLKADNAALSMDGEEPMITIGDDTVKLADYEESNWKPFSGVLHGKSGGYVSQGSSKGTQQSGLSSVVNQFLESNKERAALSPFNQDN